MGFGGKEIRMVMSTILSVNGRLIMTSRFPFECTPIHGRCEENGDSAPPPLSVAEGRHSAGETQEPPRATTSVNSNKKTVDGAAEHPTPRQSGDGHEREGTAGSSSDSPRGEGSVSDERGGQQALGSLPTTAPYSEARYDPFAFR